MRVIFFITDDVTLSELHDFLVNVKEMAQKRNIEITKVAIELF